MRADARDRFNVGCDTFFNPVVMYQALSEWAGVPVCLFELSH